MKAIVLKLFIDKATNIPYSEGRVIDVTENRFQELSDKGLVDFAPDDTVTKKKKKSNV